MPDYDDDLLEVFAQESTEHLNSLEPDLLRLEDERTDTNLINGIFRAVHSIKGASGFFGLDTIMRISHAMENLMSLIRDGAMEVDRAVVDALLGGADKLRVMIEDVGASAGVDITQEVAALEALIEGGSGSLAAAVAAPADTQLPPELEGFAINPLLLKNALRHGQSIYVIRLGLRKDIKDKGKIPLDLFKEIESLGEFMDSVFDYSVITGLDDALEPELCCEFLFATVMQPDLVELAFDVPREQLREVSREEMSRYLNCEGSGADESGEPVPPLGGREAHESACAGQCVEARRGVDSPALSAEGAPAEESWVPAGFEEAGIAVTASEEPPAEGTLPEALPEAAGKGTTADAEVASPDKAAESGSAGPAVKSAPAAAPRRKGDETIRVSVSLLDDLMNLAGEMVLARNQLMRHAEVILNGGSNMASVLQNISLVTSDLQERVMMTRLQPVGTIFSKFTRIVRDLSSKLEKEVELHLSGEGVELDKSIIEALSDPLTHIIRNCADHGIERPAVREAAGKPRCGTIWLSAEHVGGQVHIEVSDDGGGIDPERLKAKAVAKKLIEQAEADRLNDQQAQNLIFLPGFSTAETVSDVSGRGVGMDVVRTNIENLGGSIDLRSELGRGTRLCLRLPLTLAIIPAMVVGVGPRRFAVPQVNLEEIVKVSEQNRIESVRGTTVLRLRGKLLPLVRLQSLLKLAEDGAAPEVEEAGEEAAACGLTSRDYILVLRVDNNRYGLVVSELFDSEEIVVKPLSSYLKSTQCYSGATIMGDGSVAMILDTGGIAAMAELKFADIEKEERLRGGADEADARGQRQSVLLFRNSGEERFAINLSMVSRIEKIETKAIERVGESEFVKYGRSSLRLIRLHDYMPVARPETEPDWLYVIVPKLVRQPIGIVATGVEDAIESSVELDHETITGPGIFGSAVIEQTLTIFVDVYGLFEAADPRHYEATRPSAMLSRKRVLLAEDSPFFRKLEENFLREHFADVAVASNGSDAWEMLNRDPYDLLVTDMEMPGMDGFELARRVRESEKLRELPIVALTVLGAEVHRERGQKCGISAYETKLDKEKLLATFEKLFGEPAVKPADAAHL